MAAAIIAHARLVELLTFADGKFTRLVSLSPAGKVGAIAGGRRPDGYVQVSVAGRAYFAHRLAWFYVHGEWPPAQVDHVNGVRDDNRIENLRLATNAENAQNNCAAGATFETGRGLWRADIRLNGRSKFLGHFESKAEARAAYLAAKKVVHPFASEARA